MNREEILNTFLLANIPEIITQEEFNDVQKAIKQLQQENKKYKEENQELKKQLKESKDNYNCLLKQKEQFEYIMSKQVDYQGQQKEFIEWLEAMNRMYQNEYKDIDAAEHYNCILQKYKSIIGDDK